MRFYAVKRSVQSSRAPSLPGRPGLPGPALAAGLAAFLAIAQASGCAAFESIAAPAYGRGWSVLAEQAQETSARPAMPAGPEDFSAEDGDLVRACEEVPEARETIKRYRDVARSKAPTADQLKGVITDLKKVEEEAGARMKNDPRMLGWIRAQIAEMQKKAEAKLLEVMRIEPSFDLSSRSKVRVAVMKIGDAVETVRAAERELWRAFLTAAGFAPNTVFIPGCLASGGGGTAAVRAAAARLGADAVLIYTTFAATTESPFGESAAVLSFAKCMMIDTRTEYLYFNAEGECREKRIGIPGFLSALGLESECIQKAVENLRVEIGLEIERLSADRG